CEGAAASPVKGLEWLVGDWQGAAHDGTTNLASRPALNGTLLQLTFTAKRADGDSAVMLLFGFDPLTQQVKSWTFDSFGGYGEALWVRDGNQWVGQAVGVLPDGQDGSAVYAIK